MFIKKVWLTTNETVEQYLAGSFMLGALLVLLAFIWGVGHAADAPLLSDSGQRVCYDQTGKPILCPAAGEAGHGQDAQYHGLAPSFKNNGDNTVTDLNTGLMWIRQDDRLRRTWEDAGIYCDQLRVADYVDWRLPTFRELLGIVDFGRSRPALSPVFGASEDGCYWSATTKVNNDEMAGAVDFLSGADFWEQKSRPLFVRCVRGDVHR